MLHHMVKEEFESIRATVLDRLLSMPERVENFYYLNLYGEFPVLESFIDSIRSLFGVQPLAIPMRLQVWSRSVEAPLINPLDKSGRRLDREMRAKSYYYRAVVLPAMIKEAQTYRAPATNFFRQYEEERLHEWERLKALESQCMYTDEEVFNDYDESVRPLDEDDDNDYKMSICSDRDAETYGEEYSESLEDDRDSFSSAMGHIFSKGFERREEKSSDEDQDDDPEALNDYDDAKRSSVDESDYEMSICSDRDESGDGDDVAMSICSDRDDSGDQDDDDDDDDDDSFSAAMERLFAKGFAPREEKPRCEHIPPPTLARDYKPEAKVRSIEEQHQLFENFGVKVWHAFKSNVISCCRLIRDTILNLHRIVRLTRWKNPSLKSFIRFIRCDIFRGEPLRSPVRLQEHLACNSTQDWMADYKNFYGGNTEEFHDYDESSRFVDADSDDKMSICSDDPSGDLEDAAGEEDSESLDDRDSFSAAMDQIFSKLLARRVEKPSDGDDAMSICSR